MHTKKLANKNAIKVKIGNPLAVFLESLDPQAKSELPTHINFQPVCIYGSTEPI